MKQFNWILIGLSLLMLAIGLAQVEATTAQPALSAEAVRRADYFQQIVNARVSAETARGQAATPCVNGMAGIYPCEDVDLMAHMPLSTIGGGEGADIWGWTDPLTGKEYAIMTRTSGTSFVDISDPANPIYLGNLPTHTQDDLWRDVKVYKDHAFIVSDTDSFENNHGMQVFDLTQLRSVASPPATFSNTAHYAGFGRAHNIVINEDSGYAYAVGTINCSGGLQMVDIRNPIAPVDAGCFSADGYTHDAQCVNYNGPDSDYSGKEICFNANEDTVTIVDVSDKSAPSMIASQGYVGHGYTHQMWLTEDSRYLIVNDEQDERNGGHNTRTYVWDVQDLDTPTLINHTTWSTAAIDHNLYVHDGNLYMANYRAGLRIASLANVSSGKLTETAFFDIYPANNDYGFQGAWSNYPFFDSGIVIVSGIEQGLFVLRPTSGFDVSADPTPYTTCTPATVNIPVSTIVSGIYTGNLTLAASAPAGLGIGATVSPASVAAGDVATATITLPALPAGTVPITLTATDGTRTDTAAVTINALQLPNAPTLISPTDATVTSTTPSLQWSAIAGYTYTVEIATDPAFATVIATDDVNATTYTPSSLPVGTYYWRVTASGVCGTVTGNANSFTVISIPAPNKLYLPLTSN